ncbi:hypothetical protein ACFVXG_01520 [Kitasatospora sp. NPDC058162]|uniref:hypothetical protein n=1 Tax=Kitasatospora sp. NPDC058162 TaxID=3346362 RepID=UPI0036DB9ACD
MSRITAALITASACALLRPTIARLQCSAAQPPSQAGSDSLTSQRIEMPLTAAAGAPSVLYVFAIMRAGISCRSVRIAESLM